MAFHDTRTHGPMKQESIISVIDFTDSRMQEKFNLHDKKVSEFNSNHTVFFNQIAPTIRLNNEQILITTVCLYADGVK